MLFEIGGNRCSRWKRLAAFLLAGAPILMGARSASAQLVSDEAPYGRTIEEKTQIESDMERSRFRLGPVRLLPMLVLKDSGYDSNVFGTSDNRVSDWTADIRAGFHGILPIGAKSYIVGDAMPEYIWYDKLTERRAFGGLYRGDYLGFFNRASLRVGGYASKTSAILSSESEVRVLEDVRDASAAGEVQILRPLAIFGAGETQQIRYDPSGTLDDPLLVGNVTVLNRTEDVVRGGLRFSFSPTLQLSAAVEETRTRFQDDVERRDARSTAYLAGVHYDRPRFYVNLSAGYREGRQTDPGSPFPGYRTATGTYFISWFLAHPVEVTASGHRGPVYGRFLENSYFIETRNGVGVNIHVGQRVILRGFGEYGTNRYPVAVPVSETSLLIRQDDVTAYGGGFSINIFRNAIFTALARQTHYTSTIPKVGRDVFRFTTGFTLQGDFSR